MGLPEVVKVYWPSASPGPRLNQGGVRSAANVHDPHLEVVLAMAYRQVVAVLFVPFQALIGGQSAPILLEVNHRRR